jgi:hypothetical protein
LAPIPKQRLASSAFRLCEARLDGRPVLVPSSPLGARHLTNHERTRRDLFMDVLKLRLALFGGSLLHSPHL